jgi:hypothetical protein
MLSSSVFNNWISAVSGRLKSDFRISAEITYNNFPWPKVDDPIRQRIVKSANSVLEVRAQFPHSTLAALYSTTSMPVALVEAHRQLDQQVLKAFKLRSDATPERILEELFTRYAALSGSQLVFEI